MHLNFLTLFTDPPFSLLSPSIARDKKKNRGGLIDHQRKAVGVGKEENSYLFFFLALLARPRSFAGVFENCEKKNEPRSVYRLTFKQIQTDNKRV